jgi:hypothetical protein
MTPKQTAMLNVAKMLGVAVLAGTVVSLLLIHVPLPYLGIGACVLLMLVMIHWLYELELSKAEHLDALNKMK